MRAVSLFSGIGGIELGLKRHGIETRRFCELDPLARAVLARNFKGAQIDEDVRALTSLPSCDIVTAGFPCQDLSQAGGKRGIAGSRSGLVKKLFDLLSAKSEHTRPKWLLIENVPYMLSLDRGSAMALLTTRLSRLGYSWAYRVVDARCFGRPQRRPRVVLLAARQEDPRNVLFADNATEPPLDGRPNDIEVGAWYGFYWTEGSRGVGWVREGVPPIKCGSTLGIPSPPAVWRSGDGFVGTIQIRDAERLQGFPADWTSFDGLPIVAKPSLRWRLVGNAVSTEVSHWIGRRLQRPGRALKLTTFDIDPHHRWPDAGWGDDRTTQGVVISRWASTAEQIPLSVFLRHELKPLSARAAAGFLARARKCSNVVYADHFLSSLEEHIGAVAV